MTIKVERDENSKIVDVLFNGKPVKRGSMRGLKKAQELPYWNEIITPVMAENPFSGVQVDLSPLEATIYNFCVQWYHRYETGQETGAPIQTYDDMKYFLLELNAPAYMDLID